VVIEEGQSGCRIEVPALLPEIRATVVDILRDVFTPLQGRVDPNDPGIWCCLFQQPGGGAFPQAAFNDEPRLQLTSYGPYVEHPDRSIAALIVADAALLIHVDKLRQQFSELIVGKKWFTYGGRHSSTIAREHDVHHPHVRPARELDAFPQRADHLSRCCQYSLTPRIDSTRLRVLIVSFTSLLQAHYRRKVDALASMPGVDIEVLVPPFWRELWRGRVPLEREPTDAQTLHVARVLFPGNLHLAVFREKLISTLRRFRPALIDLEDEPFNLGTLQMALTRRVVRPLPALVLHASQNVVKRYPPPFSWSERFVLRDADGFLARTEDAARVLRVRGVDDDRISVVPHGVDTETFAPPLPAEREARRRTMGLSNFTVGVVGALTRQKGLETLFAALAQTPEIHALIVGEGAHRAALENEVRRLGLEARVMFRPAVSHREVARVMGAVDVFVLPSISLPNLAERFGRVLIEAMACGTPTVGSSSGEIPRVIGDGADRDSRTASR
jgi:glycosyltransferase involved in cell wall biosynthesis